MRQVGEGEDGRPAEIRGDGRFGDLDAQLLQFAVNARCAPDGIGVMHFVDQRANVDWDRRATETGLGGTPAPVPGEQAAMPRDDRGGFRDLHRFSPAAPRS